eukprot:TRINITY_DN2620_c0_g1_i1.p1 TRINITY_DN2620_c0_g1~~TRINITY_DN2620_c0_g1_i1.p1  ORF type:complete len:390 (+),score=204.65 TRINITY_DN2620_c0_g1_i1:89-1258(+)
MLRGCASRLVARPLTCGARFNSASTTSTPPPKPPPKTDANKAAKAAEEAKKAEEAKAAAAAEAKKAEAAKAAAAAKAAEDAKKAEAAKAAKAAEEAKVKAAAAEEAKKAEAAKAAAAKAAIQQKAEEARKAEEAKKAEAAKEAAAKAAAEPKAAEPDAAPAPVPTSAVEADRLHKLLSKQYEMLKAMQEEIELAKGERTLQKAINRDVALKDVPRIMQATCQNKVEAMKRGVSDAQVRMKEKLVEQSHLAIAECDKQRKELSKKNASKELPWQKDSAADMYTKTGRWFLRQQQGPESALRMTALEAGVVLVVLLYWLYQRRKQGKKQARLDAAFASVLDDADATKETITAAGAKYNETVVRKDDDVRELLSFTCEQSVTIDSLSRAMAK